jgi:hypothetical protein
LGLHTHEHHHDVPVIVPNLKIVAAFFLGLGQDNAQSLGIILRVILDALAAASPIDRSVL